MVKTVRKNVFALGVCLLSGAFGLGAQAQQTPAPKEAEATDSAERASKQADKERNPYLDRSDVVVNPPQAAAEPAPNEDALLLETKGSVP